MLLGRRSLGSWISAANQESTLGLKGCATQALAASSRAVFLERIAVLVMGSGDKGSFEPRGRSLQSFQHGSCIAFYPEGCCCLQEPTDGTGTNALT